LAQALADHPFQISANAIRMLLLTGARRGEVLGMTWKQVEAEPGVWIKAVGADQAKDPAPGAVVTRRAAAARGHEVVAQTSASLLPHFDKYLSPHVRLAA